ncbi:MAG: hypothetical protein WCS69_14145, partial [Ignavibacteriaceae bacterium]
KQFNIEQCDIYNYLIRLGYTMYSIQKISGKFILGTIIPTAKIGQINIVAVNPKNKNMFYRFTALNLIT